jgi:hypothetical protein
MRGRDQLYVGLGYARDKIENVRRWSGERHEFILSIDGRSVENRGSVLSPLRGLGRGLGAFPRFRPPL